MLGAAIIPLILFLKRHSLIVPRFKHTAFGYNGIALVSMFTALGTFARTGLVALGVLGLMLWVQSRRKALVGFGMIAGGLLGFLFMSDRWAERMATIRNPTADTSAGGRLEVWKWTLDFVASHPFGGGFDAYVVNSYVQQMPDGTEVQGVSRAFHSIYFQLLGEHGYIGLAIFAMMILTMFLNMADIRRRTRGVRELDWLHDLMKALMMTTVVYLCGGAFIGIAFQPPLYEFMSIVIAAKQYCRRAAPIAASGHPLPARLSLARPLPYARHAARSPATRIARES